MEPIPGWLFHLAVAALFGALGATFTLYFIEERRQLRRERRRVRLDLGLPPDDGD